MRTLCIDRRREKIRIFSLDPLYSESLREAVLRPELGCESQEMRELVRSGIDALPPDLREPWGPSFCLRDGTDAEAGSGEACGQGWRLWTGGCRSTELLGRGPTA